MSSRFGADQGANLDASSPSLPRWRLTATADGFEFSVEDAAYANHARRMFRNYIVSYASPDSDVDSAELIFGELTANVARHAPGPLRAALSWSGGEATLCVSDSGPGFDGSVTRPPDDLESRRGLFIVSMLGSGLSQTSGPCGTVVSVRLPVRARAR